MRLESLSMPALDACPLASDNSLISQPTKCARRPTYSFISALRWASFVFPVHTTRRRIGLKIKPGGRRVKLKIGGGAASLPPSSLHPSSFLEFRQPFIKVLPADS